jgi:hypothetical protein
MEELRRLKNNITSIDTKIKIFIDVISNKYKI